MKRLVGAVAAAMALAWAGSTSAAVLYSTSGSFGPATGDGYEEFTITALGTSGSSTPVFNLPVRLDFTYNTNRPTAEILSRVNADALLYFNDGYVQFLGEFAALDFDPTTGGVLLGGQVVITPLVNGFSARFNQRLEPCRDWVLGQNCVDMFARGLSFTFMPQEGDTLDWAISVSAVPEPATWAMMIIGFGAVGAMLRYPRTARSAPLQA